MKLSNRFRCVAPAMMLLSLAAGVCCNREHRGTAWIVEGKLNYMDDPKLKDKDPGAFRLYSVPLPKP